MPRPLWVRSGLSRPGSVLSLLVLSAVVTATALLGPLLVRALHQSALGEAIVRASALQRTVTVFTQVSTGSDIAAARGAVGQSFTAVLQTPAAQLFTPLRVTSASFANVDWAGAGASTRTASRVTAAESGCSGIVLNDGRCPTADGEVLIAADDAKNTSVTDGDTITFRLAKSSVRSLVVVGRYDPEATLPGVLARRGTPDASLSGITGDPLIVTADQLATMRLPVTVTADVSLRTGLQAAQESAVRDALAQVEATSKVGVAGQQLFFTSLVGPLLDVVGQSAADAAVLLELVIAQAVAVALFALVIVLQRVASARTGEWTLGRLRGLPRGRWLVSVYVEPASALLAGVLVGIGLGLVLARVATRIALGPNTELEPLRAPVAEAVVGAALAGLVALVITSVPGLRRPPIEVIQQSAERRRMSVGVLLVQAMVIVLAVVSLYQLSSQDDLTVGRSRLGLLAPALLALGFGVIGVRALVLVVRALTRRPPRSRTGLVATRRAARMPSSLNPAMVIAAGLALAVFSGQVLALSERNVGLRADAAIGAPTVLQVSRPGTLDLVSAVDRADPTGRYAMAVQEKAASSDGGTSRIVAVDATRFDTISRWQQRWAGLGPLRDRLRPGLSAPLVLVGHTVTVDVANAQSHVLPLPDSDPGADPKDASPPGLDVTVETDHGWQVAPLGPLTPGSHRYRADLKFQLVKNGPFVDACLSGCRLVSLDVQPDPNYGFSFGYQVRSISTDTQPVAQTTSWLAQPGWHERTEFRIGASAMSATVQPSTSGLTVQSATAGAGDRSVVVPGDTSEQLPVVLGRSTVAQPAQDGSEALTGTGLDGQAQLIRVLGNGTLPRALDDGVLADLRNIQGLSDSAENEATSEVWLAADAPAGIREALKQAGLQVTGEQTIAATRSDGLRAPITRGAALGVIIGLVATALSLLTLAVARAADASRNRRVWRALLEAGQPPRVVRVLVAAEVAVPAVVGVLVGAAAGVVATVLARGRIPLLTNVPPGPPFDLVLERTPIVVVAAVSVLVVLVVAGAAALIETRAARSGR